MSYKSPEMDKLIDGARNAAAIGDMPTYDSDVKGFVDLAFTDIPRVPLYQPFVNVAMQKNISGLSVLVPSRLDLSRARKGVRLIEMVRLAPLSRSLRTFSLPPCGGGSGWGVAASSAPAVYPTPSPQGGGGQAVSSLHADHDRQAVLFAIPSLIGVVIVTFLLTRALPGDPAAYFAGPAAS